MNTLKKGCAGSDVRLLQQRLGIAADGIFGTATEQAVKKYQLDNGLAADGIAGPATWNLILAQNSGNPRTITEIIVHCSATPEGEDYTVPQIRAMHIAGGFDDIGYHYVVYRDGTVVQGRAESKIGAHCKEHNANSIGVCYIGGCPPREYAGWNLCGKDTRTGAQKESLLKILKELRRKYPAAKIYGHRDFANKLCPSFDAAGEYRNL